MRPVILGLTGSIGMGKSTVAAMFAQEGIAVFDADAHARRMQGPGGSLVPAIEKVFPGTTDQQGVKRDLLGAKVFGDPDALEKLEAIVHPAVRAERDAFLAANTEASFVMLDIPLLFEKGGFADVDQIIVVSAPAAVQRARVLARGGMTAEKFEQVLARQMPDAEKRARADHIIDTGHDLAQTRAQVKRLVDKLSGALR